MKKTILLSLAFATAFSAFGQKKSKDYERYSSGDLNLTIVRQPEGNFTEVISHGGNVAIRQGETSEVKFFGKTEDLQKIQATWRDNKLSISSSDVDVRVEITMPTIQKIAVSGSGDVMAINDWNVADMSLSVAGSGDMKLKALSGKNVRISVAGTGDIKTSGGLIESLSVSVAGSGNVNTQATSSKSAVVRVAGSGDAAVGASDTLDASVSGSGDISYRGTPALTEKIVGSGEIRKAD